MSRERFACGCVADDRSWLAQCEAHRAEHDAMHKAHIEFRNIAAHDGVAATEEG